MTGKFDRAVARRDFEASLPFTLDKFQLDAMDALDAGKSVVVAAPTGSGKTMVAEYAVSVALFEGKRAFYTTPIKALSNQKFRDLSERYGAHNVGLLTGDTSVNDTAPIVVMTTEVLRNMIHANSRSLGDLRFVVMDEVHYLQDTYRGPVWEEVIISTPMEVDLVCLSATVSNAHDLADWVSSVRGATDVIVHTERPVELTQLFMVGHRNDDDVDVYPTFVEGRPNPEAVRVDATASRSRDDDMRRGRFRSDIRTPGRLDIVETLQYDDLLPAIYFIFSRAACDEAMRQCLSAGLNLTHPSERAEIRSIVENRIAGLSDSDLDALDYSTFIAALERGVAAHHAGLVPPFKEAVEACFTLGLVKVVFATETLALGINMPARAVVIEKLSKYTGAGHKMLTAAEFTQLTGRAGRRGIDKQGFAATLFSPQIGFEEIAELASQRTYELKSAFRPTYNLAANLIKRSSREQAHHFLKLSFAQFQIDATLVRANATAERLKREITEARQAATCARGDVSEYRAIHGLDKLDTRWVDDERSTNDKARLIEPDLEPGVTPAQIDAALEGLKPGTVIRYVPRSKGTDEQHGVVVFSTARRGDRITVRALTVSGRSITVEPRDIRSVPETLGFARVPVPYNPQSRRFLKELTENLNRALAKAGRSAAGVEPRNGKKQKEPRGEESIDADLPLPDGVAGCPDLKKHLLAATKVDRLNRDLTRQQRVSSQRSNSLVDQFDRVLALLDEVGCTDDWSLTDTGKTLCGVFHECDLLIADCLRAGLFDGLNPPQVAALASVFVYERRGPAPRRGERSFDVSRSFPKSIYDRWLRISDRADILNDREAALELPLTRLPDPGFAAIAHGWASGKGLDRVMADEEVTGGDLVRSMKALIDLLRQMGDVAPNHETREAARTASTKLFRGVVAASSTGTPVLAGPALGGPIPTSLIPIVGTLEAAAHPTNQAASDTSPEP
jgi:ATP-dependent RNA helicase HelY